MIRSEDPSTDRPNAPPGRVVISLDAELAWGFHDLDRQPADRIEHARSSWLRLLELFDEFRVPASWLVVGHLFLDACDGVHADHPRSPDWFTADPGGTGATDWLAPDLVRAIQEADVEHEIGSHTFSHVVFDDPETTAEVIDVELGTAVDLAKGFDLELRSLAFPRNIVGHRQLLADHGFRSYRGTAPPRWFEGRRLRPLYKVVEFAFGRSAPPVVTPTEDEDGLVNIPASLFLWDLRGPVNRLITALFGDPIVEQVRLGLEAAADQGEVLHLWLHPNDLTGEADFTRFRAILALVSAYRARGKIDVCTMDEIALAVLDEPAAQIHNA